MEALIPKWHRELELFSAVKPLLIMEGNITDQYRYPVDGSVRQDEIISLSRYLQAYFSDEGYDQVIFYSNLVGFVSPYDPSMLERFAALTETEIKQGAIPSEFKGNDANTAPNVITMNLLLWFRYRRCVILNSVTVFPCPKRTSSFLLR